MKPIKGLEVANQIRKAIAGDVEVLLENKDLSWDKVWAGDCVVYVGEWKMVFFNDCDSLDYCQEAVRPDGRKGEISDWYEPYQQPLDLLTSFEYEAFERVLKKAKKEIDKD
ncbi:MAG: hypothetical protein M0R32_11085 [Candidatus Cloacimonetes bacterium]|jgi:hypothetical protein|nr:hypothetical protein [Candidatus Cloacimonadota bacterium]